MNTNQAPLLLNIGFVAKQSIGYSREFLFVCPSIVLQSDVQAQNLEGKIILSRTSEGLLARGNFKAAVHSVCGRCLVAFELGLEGDFTELITFAAHATEDTEIIYPEDGQFNFTPVVTEYLMLDIPINPVCNPDCKGLCAICGNNLNLVECEHAEEPIDPRFEILSTLLDEE